MAEEGAILIGDNLLDSDNFSHINVIGDWTDEENLLTPQLEPAAYFAGANGDVFGVEIVATGLPSIGYNAIGLMGTDIGINNPSNPLSYSNYALTVEVYQISSWLPVEDYTVHEINSPGSPRSLVILLGEFTSKTRYRVRWRKTGSRTGYLGHVICGRVLRKIDIADRGWSMRYRDLAKREVSEGGQIYTGDPRIVREMTIPARSVSRATAFGLEAANKQIEVPSPTATGAGVVNGDWVEFGDGESGEARWSGLLEFGKYYRVDFEQRQVQQDPDGPVSPRWRFLNPDIGDDQHEPTGFASVYGLSSSPDIVCICDSLAIHTGQTSIRVAAVYEVDSIPEGWGYKLELASLQAVFATHGQSRPVVAMVRPGDPMMNRVTGIYGYLASDNEITQRGDADGDHFSASLRITEAR